MDSLYVRISFYNPRNAVSVLPLSKKAEVLAILSSLFDNTQYTRKHILESALHNLNMIVHTVGMVLSASRIEHSKGEFWMYREAFSNSVVNVIKALDKQKNNILNCFDCDSLDYFEAAKWRNEEDLSKNAMEVFASFANSSNKGPTTLEHRYLLEDVPAGLCLFSSIGKVVDIETTIADSLIHLSSALLKRDFWQTARTIQKLLKKEHVIYNNIINAING